MPKRNTIVHGADARWRVTRRGLLAGGASLGFAATTSSAFGAPLRIGVVGILGFEAADVDEACRHRWGRPAIVVPFSSWASLEDHASAPGDSLIDGAVLPRDQAADGCALPRPRPIPAAIVTTKAAPDTPFGVALRHPLTDAAVRLWLANGATATLMALPPAALLPNLAAGLLGGAVLLGPDAVEAARRGRYDVTMLDGAGADALVPPLALVLRRDASRAEA